MENPFELLKPSPYVSTNIGLPLQELQLASQRLSDMNQKNISAMDELDILFSNIKANPYDKAAPEIIEKAKANVYKDIEDIANLENKTASPQASQLIRQAYKKFASDKGLQKVMENYELYDRYNKMVEKERAEGKVFDLIPENFQSVTTDEEGNPVYNTWENPYQVYNNWDEKEAQLWDQSLKEVFMDLNLELPSKDELDTMPYSQIIKKRGISMAQVESKLDDAFNAYMRTPQGQQKLKVYEYNSGLDTDEVKKVLKEEFKERGGLFTYTDQDKAFRNLPEKFFEGYNNAPESPKGITRDVSVVYEPRKKGIALEILNNVYDKEEDPESYQLQQELKNLPFQNPEFASKLNNSLAEKSNWDVTGDPKNGFIVSALKAVSALSGSPGFKPFINAIAESKNPKKKFDEFLKESFPEEVEANTFDGIIDYNKLNESLSTYNYVKPIYTNSSYLNYLETSEREKAEVLLEQTDQKFKLAKFLDTFLKEAAKEYYENEDRTEYKNVNGIIFDGSTEGNKYANSLSTLISRYGQASNPKILKHSSIKNFDNKEFDYDLSTAKVKGLSLMDGEPVFKTDIKGKYKKEDEKTHEIYITFDDMSAITGMIGILPKEIQNEFLPHILGRGTDIISSGASFYLDRPDASGIRKKVPYPEGYTVKKVGDSDEYGIFYNGKLQTVEFIDPETGEKKRARYTTPKEEVSALIGQIILLNRDSKNQ
jgi:hypothetical protein